MKSAWPKPCVDIAMAELAALGDVGGLDRLFGSRPSVKIVVVQERRARASSPRRHR